MLPRSVDGDDPNALVIIVILVYTLNLNRFSEDIREVTKIGEILRNCMNQKLINNEIIPNLVVYIVSLTH